MESHLHWADYLILVVFLVISLAIGVYHSLTGGRQKTTAEFIMADRKLKVIPTAISMLVSIVSAALLLGMTAEMYCYGIQLLIFCIVAVVLSMLLIERLIVPWLYPMKLVSVFDYLEKRYMSKAIRIFGASLGIFSGILMMGVGMYAPSAALESATGLPISVSIPVMAVVSVAYTALGGMRAVIWTDVFQFLIMTGGMIAILVKGLIVVGGISNVFRVAGEEGRLVYANFSFDPRERHTVWGIVIGMTFIWFHLFGLTQAAVQRFSAVEKLSKARTTILLNIPAFTILIIISGLIGLVVLAYYSSIKCDPLANKDIANSNMLLPFFVVTIFADSPGFSGLFLATLYGGALSTVSSSLSGSAANCWEDILKWKLSHLPEIKKAAINRLLVVVLGAVSTGVAFLSASVPGPITQVILALLSSVNGPLLAFFFLGAASKHANWKGMMLGGMVGVVILFWLSIGSLTVGSKHPSLPALSVERCSLQTGNSTLFSSSLNDTKYTSFEIIGGIGAQYNRNGTSKVQAGSGVHGTTQLRGLENVYAISYLWFTLLGAFITGTIGIIASLITRDKDLEAKVDERLLMRVNICGWTDENENEEHLDDKNYIAIQEIKGLNEPDVDLLKDVQIKAPTTSENLLHQDIENCDQRKKRKTDY